MYLAITQKTHTSQDRFLLLYRGDDKHKIRMVMLALQHQGQYTFQCLSESIRTDCDLQLAPLAKVYLTPSHHQPAKADTWGKEVTRFVEYFKPDILILENNFATGPDFVYRCGTLQLDKWPNKTILCNATHAFAQLPVLSQAYIKQRNWYYGDHTDNHYLEQSTQVHPVERLNHAKALEPEHPACQ